MTRYELLERIGAGKTAEIFRGRLAAAMGFEKPVVVKKIRRELGKNPRFIKALITEAKLLAKVRHKGIVQVFDVGVEGGEYFLVMEYVDGTSLKTVLVWLEAGNRFPIDVAAHIGAELGDALEHAHRGGVVHRAVSPTSVLFSWAGEVKLGDFGSARGDPSTTGKDDVRAVGALLRKMLAHRDDLPRDLERIIRKTEAGEWNGAGEVAAALRDFRYSASTSSGEPARELANVLKLVAQVPRERDQQRIETSVVVQLSPIEVGEETGRAKHAPARPADRRLLWAMLAVLAFAAGVLVAALFLRKLG